MARIKCWYCGTVGHPEHQCRKKKADEAKKDGEGQQDGPLINHSLVQNELSRAGYADQPAPPIPHHCCFVQTPMWGYGNPLGWPQSPTLRPEADTHSMQGTLKHDFMEGRIIATVDKMLRQQACNNIKQLSHKSWAVGSASLGAQISMANTSVDHSMSAF